MKTKQINHIHDILILDSAERSANYKLEIDVIDESEF